MIRRLLPYPHLTVALIAVWMMLVNRFAWGSLVFAVILGLLLPLVTAIYWPDRPGRLRPLKAAAYLLLVLWDIVKANVEVTRLVLFVPNRDFRPAWICVPLDLTRPEAITALAATITLTPGTLSCDLSEDHRCLLVHCLHAPDPEAVVADIKARYESRLKEIFP